MFSVIPTPLTHRFIAINLKTIWEYNPTRFIVFLSHALNYSFGRYDVFGYHLVNTAIHLLNALLVFWFTGLLLRSPEVQCETGNWKLETGNPVWIPLFAGLLFAVHPIQTQSVTYIYQRSSSLTALFYLLSMTLYLRGRSIPSPLAGEGQGGGDKTSGYLFYMLSLISAIVAMFTNLTQFNVIRTYIRLLFLPVNQNLDYDYPLSSTFFEPMTILSFVLLVFLLFLAIRLFKKHSIISFGILFFFLALSLQSSIIPINDVIVESRLYLPSIGFILVVSAGMNFLKGHYPVYLFAGLVFIIITAAGITAYQRNKVWEDEMTLWTDVVDKSPDKSRAHNNLGRAYNSQGRTDKAIENYSEAIRLNPKNANAHTNLGLSMMIWIESMRP